MKKLAFIAAAAATLALTVPASAQGFSVGVGERGVGVGVDTGPRYDRGDRGDRGYRSRAQFRGDRDVVVIKKKRVRDWDRPRRKTVIITR